MNCASSYGMENRITKNKLVTDIKTVVYDAKDLLKLEAANRTIHEHPYRSLGVALGAGLLIGWLFGRR